jgi:hypothetical protein
MGTFASIIMSWGERTATSTNCVSPFNSYLSDHSFSQIRFDQMGEKLKSQNCALCEFDFARGQVLSWKQLPLLQAAHTLRQRAVRVPSGYLNIQHAMRSVRFWYIRFRGELFDDVQPPHNNLLERDARVKRAESRKRP